MLVLRPPLDQGTQHLQVMKAAWTVLWHNQGRETPLPARTWHMDSAREIQASSLFHQLVRLFLHSFNIHFVCRVPSSRLRDAHSGLKPPAGGQGLGEGEGQ